MIELRTLTVSRDAKGVDLIEHVKLIGPALVAYWEEERPPLLGSFAFNSHAIARAWQEGQCFVVVAVEDGKCVGFIIVILRQMLLSRDMVAHVVAAWIAPHLRHTVWLARIKTVMRTVVRASDASAVIVEKVVSRSPYQVRQIMLPVHRSLQ